MIGFEWIIKGVIVRVVRVLVDEDFLGGVKGGLGEVKSAFIVASHVETVVGGGRGLEVALEQVAKVIIPFRVPLILWSLKVNCKNFFVWLQGIHLFVSD